MRAFHRAEAAVTIARHTPARAQPWTLTARLYPGAHWRGTVSSAAGGQTIDMERVSLEETLIVRQVYSNTQAWQASASSTSTG